MSKNYAIAQLDEVDDVPCPCGTSRRAFGEVEDAVADYEDSANDGEGDVDMQYDIELLDDLIDVMRRNTPRPVEEEELPGRRKRKRKRSLFHPPGRAPSRTRP